MQTDSVPVVQVTSRTTPTSDTPRVSSANLETLGESLDTEMTFDDTDQTSDDTDQTSDDTDQTSDDTDQISDDTDQTSNNTDQTSNNINAVLNGPDAVLDSFGETLDNFNALSFPSNIMSTESPPPRRASTESPALPDHASSPASLFPLTNHSPSQSQGSWTPSHPPLWTLSGSTSRELKDALDIQGGGLEQHWVNESRVS